MMKVLILTLSLSILAACGPTVKVKIEGTKDGVNVTTTQTAKDSSGVNISVNPNINFTK